MDKSSPVLTIITKIDTSLKMDVSKYYPFIENESVIKIKKLRNEIDKVRSLIGELQLRKALCLFYKQTNQDIAIKRHDKGKPYLANSPLEFNISHSGEYVVCVLGPCIVGVDIEEKKEINFSVATEFYSDKEYDVFMSLHQIDQHDFLYNTWTSKESYLKMIGEGLLQSPKEFSAYYCPQTQNYVTSIQNNCNFMKLDFSDKYAGTICINQPVSENIIHTFSQIQILNYFKG